MVEYLTNGTAFGEQDSQGDKRSVMRKFWESEDEAFIFKWPNQKTHYDFTGPCPDFIKHERPLGAKTDSSSAFVDQYRAESGISFKHPFAVKSIRANNSKRQQQSAIREVEIMSGLCYPHVTALLGTYTFQTRLHILVYPAAWGDLREFLELVCDERKELYRADISNEYHKRITTASKDTPDSGSTASSVSIKLTSGDAIQKKLSLQGKITKIRQWFVCLSRALEYLHDNNVRHKDIKPENVLIDHSGSALLTDFGISRQFKAGATHRTNDQLATTVEYASPELIARKPRDDTSDIFSLGCVFMEMASVVLDHDLDAFRNERTLQYTSSGHPSAYHCNLPQVYAWAEGLREQARQVRAHKEAGPADSAVHDFSADHDEVMADAITFIVKMLDKEPTKRPKTKELWEGLQYVSIHMCKDCDPRLHEDHRWKPTQAQSERTRKVAETLLSMDAQRKERKRGRHLSTEEPSNDHLSRLSEASDESGEAVKKDPDDSNQPKAPAQLARSGALSLRRHSLSAEEKPKEVAKRGKARTGSPSKRRSAPATHTSPLSRTMTPPVPTPLPSEPRQTRRFMPVKQEASVSGAGSPGPESSLAQGGLKKRFFYTGTGDSRTSNKSEGRSSSEYTDDGQLTPSIVVRRPTSPIEGHQLTGQQENTLSQYQSASSDPPPEMTSTTRPQSAIELQNSTSKELSSSTPDPHPPSPSNNQQTTIDLKQARPVGGRSATSLIQPEKECVLVSVQAPLTSEHARPVSHQLDPRRDYIVYFTDGGHIEVMKGSLFKHLGEGVILRWYEISATDQNVPIFEDGVMVFSVNFSKLSYWVRLRRLLGYHPIFCVVFGKESSLLCL